MLRAQNSAFLDYIEKYKKIAIKEMERAGVPASIKLAQGLLESNAGRSTLAKRAKNHFGIKCHSGWTGRTFEKEDDDYDEFGNLKKSCFRRYRKDEDSYIAHSEFLRDPKKGNRYGFLFRLDPLDYKRWARGLKRAGYATAAGYDKKLIRLIEDYQLQQYDLLGIGDYPAERPSKDKDLIAGLDVRKINSARVVVAGDNLSASEISSRSGVSVRRLKKYNKFLPEITKPLPEGYRVFLQPKRCRYRGKTKWHYVREGETMFDISQEYGVNLNRLYKRNRMEEGSQPQADQRIKLKGWNIKKGAKPRLVSEPKPTTVDIPLEEPDDDFMDDDITPNNPATNPSNPTTNPQPTNPQPSSGADNYTVMKGDTLYNLSRRFGLTVDELMRLNNLNSTVLSIGQILRVK